MEQQKKFYKKFFYGMKKSPFCTLIELYDTEYRLSLNKPNILYHSILTYCNENNLLCKGEKITLGNGEERFKITIHFN